MIRSIKAKSNVEALFELQKAHYVRADGFDREWDVYQTEEHEYATHLSSMIPEGLINQITIFNSSKHYEIYATIELNTDKLPDEETLEAFCQELSGDAIHYVKLVGNSDFVIFYYESY